MAKVNYAAALKAALELSKFCDQHEGCVDCEFHEEYAGCLLTVIDPYQWDEDYLGGGNVNG